MKFISIIAILLLVTLSTADEYVVKSYEDLLQYRKECVADLKVPEANIELYKKLEFPNDQITQCYLKCIFTKFGLFDTKTGFDVESVHKQLVGNQAEAADHDNEVHAKIQACVDNNEQGSNACEWAYRGVTCILKNNVALVNQQHKKP
uniref:Odorant binding protein n=1 Tax=Liriomyza trifolii TaxID=198433 RepID=A0A2Z4SVE8_LIRTR|nr:odorant binding protein [Liriomyza trifolii]